MLTHRQCSSLVLLTGLGLLNACATPAPVEEIKLFTKSFTSVDAVGQLLLDDLALAERAQGQQIAQRRAQNNSSRGPAECGPTFIPWQLARDAQRGFINGFCSADAGYFSALGDPPATAAMRGALRVIERYAEVLSILAEGRNVEDAIGQINTLGAEVGGLIALAGASVAITPALTALKPVLEQAAKQSSATEAQRLVLDGAVQVSALIGALRQAAPALFFTLTEAGASRIANDAAGTGTEAELARIELYRVNLSNYVVLLHRLQASWDSTVAAAQGRPGSGMRLARLSATSAEIRTEAASIRRSFSLLRNIVPTSR